jgi:phytoene synthase
MLERSYAYCRGVARTQARNFYYSFLLLSKPQRDAMCAVYAFMRHCDDLSDDAGVSDPCVALATWRDELTAALNGRYGDHPCWPALHDSVIRYGIPHQYFYDMIAGVSSDLGPRDIETFDELYRYCYLVASVVGLTVIHIFGFNSPRALDLAEKCGVAFQLTNILRDVKEDQERGRVYIPREDRDRFGDDFRALMRFETERARRYYGESRPLIGMIHPGSRASMWALIEIYRRLLDRIEESNYDVLRRRIRLSSTEKVRILLEGLVKSKFGQIV